MNNMKYVNYLLAVCILASFISCETHAVIAPKDNNPIPDSVARAAVVATAMEKNMIDEIKLNGKIIPNEAKQAKVYALISGRIKSVSVEQGDYVRKGQALAKLESTEVAGIANDVSVSELNLEIARKNVESTESLYKSNLATEKDLINARLEYEKAASGLTKAKRVASITGGQNASYIISSPINGFVVEKNITGNSEVRQDNSTNLFTIADLSNVWIIANVYEADIPNVHLGDEVTVNTLSEPERNHLGRIDKMYDVLDPSTRTMKVRISMDNPTNDLKPEMFATITVKGRASGKMVCIPSEAVILSHSKRYVVVKKDDRQLQVREIQLVKRIGEDSFVAGVSAGEQVVTNSQVFLFEALSSR
jgi:cobalt-zinc-cadmium efflux system membrane fusion protein